jgi:hypothetical protein
MVESAMVWWSADVDMCRVVVIVWSVWSMDGCWIYARHDWPVALPATRPFTRRFPAIS